MQAGQVALIFALSGSVAVALITALASRHGNLMKRGTDMTTIYMNRLKDTELKNDELEQTVQNLREQHIVDLTALQEIRVLKAEITELKNVARKAQALMLGKPVIIFDDTDTTGET